MTTETIAKDLKAALDLHNEDGEPCPDIAAAVRLIAETERRKEARNRVQLPLMFSGTQGNLI